jgi:hypothetical protein
VRIGSNYVWRRVVARGVTLAEVGGAWWLHIMAVCASRLQRMPASSPACRQHLPKLHSGVMPRPRLGAEDKDDSNAARHQPLYRDQTVSKGKDTSISIR